MEVKIRKGKNIPIEGIPNDKVKKVSISPYVSLSVAAFDDIGLRLIKKEGEKVLIGEPILSDRNNEKRMFVSPAAGVIKEIKRGEKRRILDVIIETNPDQKYFQYQSLQLENLTPQELIDFWMESGALSSVRTRPCNKLMHRDFVPKSIFIQAIASAPFAPCPSHEAKHFEADFLNGIKALSYIGVPIHVVSSGNQEIFSKLENVNHHIFKGPHPVANPSLHISYIDPIKNLQDYRWALTVHDVIAIGMVSYAGKTHHQKIISLAGEGIAEENRHLYLINNGINLAHLQEVSDQYRVISGDPLVGAKIEKNGFLGLRDHQFSVIPNIHEKRQWLHFFRLGLNKYTLTRTYLSYLQNTLKRFSFDTNQHGEERAFVDTEVYDKVFPFKIPLILLVKALLSEDYEKAIDLGALEVVEEDFALPTFICPSKIDMVSIVRKRLREIAQQYM